MMETTTVLFYLFAVVLLGASARVITAKSTVHAALFLILAFFTASGLWMLLKAEFLAITLVLVYVGAVMVLFLFVVMMLDINQDEMRAGFWKHLPLAGLVGALIALEMAAVLLGGFKVSVAKEMPPEVNLLDFKLEGPQIAVRPYTANEHYWQVYFDTNEAIVRVCQQAGWPTPAALHRFVPAA